MSAHDSHDPRLAASAAADAATAAPVRAPRRWPMVVVTLVTIVLAVLAAAAAAQALPGAPWVAASACVIGMALGYALRRRPPAGQAATAATAATANVTDGADNSLIRQVVPVWLRTAESVRHTAEKEAEALTERFARVSAHLDVALAATAGTPQMDVGAIDALLERHQPEIDRLRADARAALDASDAASQELRRVEGSAQVLARLAKEVQGIARATHMLGLNAAVEATRAGAAGGGFAVVAHDIRALAAQSRQAAVQMVKEVDGVQQRLATARSRGADTSLDDEDLALRSEVNARAVLRALLGSMGDVARSSRTLQEAGRKAQADIDDILMSLQGHDRVNQMLQSVITDIGRMSAWLDGGSDEAAASAAEWLERLDKTYTMEEMRSTHHGTKAVEAQTAVEFF